MLIVDDHPLMRTGLAAVLEEDETLQIVGQATNGCEAVEVHRRLRPDIVLMDIQMPEMDGVAATKAICREFPDARIIVFTTYRGDVQARDALVAGAKAYLLKSAIRTELIDAIREVSSGRRYIAADVARELAEHMESESLSNRERQVIECIAAGNSNKRVGALLGISEDTVKNHVKSILGKLGALDRTHAINIAYRRGILAPK
ncbi:MAG: response regulator transcription factor [Dokdonella sp.]|uniref:response regulator transcription factor n=1 Tax=Dokdonella sp. TaxID=2291710 RepID=UPI003264F942